MRRINLILYFLFLTWGGAAFAAANEQGKTVSAALGTLIDDAALDSAKNTGWIEVTGFKLLVLRNNYTRNNGTSISMTCYENATNSDTGRGTIQKATGETYTDLTPTKAVTASTIWPWRLDVNGYRWVKCEYSCDSSGACSATDKITVTGYRARGE